MVKKKPINKPGGLFKIGENLANGRNTLETGMSLEKVEHQRKPVKGLNYLSRLIQRVQAHLWSWASMAMCLI